MPAIAPVSDLRNYGEVLGDVQPGSPVFLTKNGRGRYALLDMADYDKLVAQAKLIGALEEGRRSGDDRGWMSADEVRARLSMKAGDNAV